MDGESGRRTPIVAAGMWPLTQESRHKIVTRIAANLAALSFFSGGGAGPSTAAGGGACRLDDEAAREHALVIEREALAVAEGLASGSGGVAQSALVLAYAQHASDAMIALLKAKMGPGTGATPPGVAASLALSLDLSQSGTREFVDEARARELLQPLLEGTPDSHHTVRLSTKSFRPEACGVVVSALQRHRGTLQHADLSDIIAGQTEDAALTALAEITGALAGVPLRSLDLSNNALGEKGVRACAPALSSQRCLSSLVLCNNGISAEAGEAIVELLAPECVQTLDTLHFHNNMTGEAGALALSVLVGAAAESGLRDLRFSSTRVQSEGAVSLAQALARGSNLTRLDMRDNMFGEEGATALAQALPRHTNLKELYLGDTLLTSDGACLLLEALASSCTQLRDLDLAGNEITAEGGARLAAALGGLPHLRRLVLSENELGDAGAQAVVEALAQGNKELEELDLCTNEIGDAGAKVAAEAACQLPCLSALLLNGNSISKGGIEAIKGVLVSQCPRGLQVLGPLDENDDGEPEEDD